MIAMWEGISAVATAIVGIAGIGATIWVQRQERNHTSRQLAEDRTQTRRQAAYERLLLQAIRTTEFVCGADTIFVRHAMPPDVDTESYDAWMLLDLYTSDAFQSAYSDWSSAIERVRDILDRVPDKKMWHQMKQDLQTEFVDACGLAEEQLRSLHQVARLELN